MVKKTLITSIIITLFFNLILQLPVRADFSYADLKCVDEEVFSIIKKAYAEVDFYGEFEKGNPASHDYFRKQYFKIVNLERTFKYKAEWQKGLGGKKMHLNDLNEIKVLLEKKKNIPFPDTYNLKDCIFYFFDMDIDGLPELGITTLGSKVGGGRFIYFIKYDIDSDEFILWFATEATSIQLMGSQKIWKSAASTGPRYFFYKLNQDGTVEYWLHFGIYPYFNKKNQKVETAYMVELPRFKDTSKNIVLTEKMEQQAYRPLQSDDCFFRVTKEQWDELTKDYFEARKLTKENIKKASFTYDELFGDL